MLAENWEWRRGVHGTGLDDLLVEDVAQGGIRNALRTADELHAAHGDPADILAESQIEILERLRPGIVEN